MRESIMKRVVRILAICAITGANFLLPCSIHGQTPTTKYFSDTGHSVRGEFLEFFEAHGGLAVFGYPLTDEFTQDGRRIQYFQKVRMEWNPESPEPYNVQLGLLGDELGYRKPPISPAQIPPANHPQRRYYSETGHTVSFAFLDYFDEHGGLDVFGYPITELLVERGLIVQYFQRACLEWHSENSHPDKVQLGILGEIDINKKLEEKKLDPTLLDPQPPPAIITPPTSPATSASSASPTTTPTPMPPVTAIDVSASVKYAITGQESYQTVYVYVTDQRGRGLSGAQVSFVAHYTIEDRNFSTPPTDTSGYTRHTFSVGNPLPGYIIVIDVTVTYGDLTSTTQTSFLPWW
jgi:hypothetical protein